MIYGFIAVRIAKKSENCAPAGLLRKEGKSEVVGGSIVGVAAKVEWILITQALKGTLVSSSTYSR